MPVVEGFGSSYEKARSAIEAMIKIERSRQIDEQYAEAYTRMPQTDEELAHLGHQSFAHLDDEDWSEWL